MGRANVLVVVVVGAALDTFRHRHGGVEPPVGRNPFHALQIRFLGGTNHQGAFLEVAGFEQNFVLGNLEMLVHEAEAEALQPMVLHQHVFDFRHARLIFGRQRFDIINVGQRCKFGFHNRRVLVLAEFATRHDGLRVRPLDRGDSGLLAGYSQSAPSR